MWGFQIYTIAQYEFHKFKNNIKSGWIFEIVKDPEDVSVNSPTVILRYYTGFPWKK